MEFCFYGRVDFSELKLIDEFEFIKAALLKMEDKITCTIECKYLQFSVETKFGPENAVYILNYHI